MSREYVTKPTGPGRWVRWTRDMNLQVGDYVRSAAGSFLGAGRGGQLVEIKSSPTSLVLVRPGESEEDFEFYLKLENGDSFWPTDAEVFVPGVSVYEDGEYLGDSEGAQEKPNVFIDEEIWEREKVEGDSPFKTIHDLLFKSLVSQELNRPTGPGRWVPWTPEMIVSVGDYIRSTETDRGERGGQVTEISMRPEAAPLDSRGKPGYLQYATCDTDRGGIWFAYLEKWEPEVSE